MNIRIKFSVLTATSILTFIGCQSVTERSSKSGYSDRVNPQVVKRLNPNTTTQIETKTRLKQLENGIATKKELEQYSKALPYLKSDEEKIDYLTLPGFEARQKWMKDEGFSNRVQVFNDTYRDLIEAQDIGLGMPTHLVKKSWGEPDSVEISGNPQFKNERWKYNKYVSTPDGYKQEKKVVYFEGGRVVGWEVE